MARLIAGGGGIAIVANFINPVLDLDVDIVGDIRQLGSRNQNIQLSLSISTKSR
jgi:hypothetical protein